MTLSAHEDQQLFPAKTSHKLYIKDWLSDHCDRCGTGRLHFLCRLSFGISNVIIKIDKILQIAKSFFNNHSNRIQA